MASNLEDDLKVLESALLARPASGPWDLWTSCSWLRVKGPTGEDVIGPCQDADGQLNLKATRETLSFVVACDPERMKRMLDAVRTLMLEHACMKARLQAMQPHGGGLLRISEEREDV